VAGKQSFQHGLIHTVLYLFLHCDIHAVYVQIYILQNSYTGDSSELVHTVSKPPFIINIVEIFCLFNTVYYYYYYFYSCSNTSTTG
jgi:hypothetical protein